MYTQHWTSGTCIGEKIMLSFIFALLGIARKKVLKSLYALCKTFLRCHKDL